MANPDRLPPPSIFSQGALELAREAREAAGQPLGDLPPGTSIGQEQPHQAVPEAQIRELAEDNEGNLILPPHDKLQPLSQEITIWENEGGSPQ